MTIWDEAPVAGRSLIGTLENAARSQPERTYFHAGDATVTYSCALRAVRGLSRIIEEMRWGSDSVPIGVSVERPDHLLYIAWACVDAGVSLAFCPRSRDPLRMQSAMGEVGARVLLTDIDGLSESWAIQVGDLLTAECRSACPDSVLKPAAPGSADHAAFVFQTSGTEGEPKWVYCHYWKCLAVIECMQRAGTLRHAVRQTVYLTPPLSHSYGMSAMLEYTLAQGTLLFPRGDLRFGAVGALVDAQLARQVTAIEGVPYFYSLLSKLRRIQLPMLSHIGFGGGDADPAVLSALRERWPAASYSVRYGLTETPSVVSHKMFRPPYQDNWRSSGKVLPIYEVEIVDEHGQPLPHSHEGEIVIHGATLAGYSGESEGPRVLLTGDLGYLDGGGELFVVGRKSTFLKHHGFRVSPQQVESALGSLPGVHDCRVCVRGPHLVAEVVFDGDARSRVGMLSRLSERLPAYALPDEIVSVASIPRTASGKTKRY